MPHGLPDSLAAAIASRQTGLNLRSNRSNHFKLDWSAPRQLGDTDRGAGVAATFAEAFDQPIGSAVHDLRLPSKSRREGDVSNNFQYLNYFVRPARYLANGGYAKIRAESRSLLRGF